MLLHGSCLCIPRNAVRSHSGSVHSVPPHPYTLCVCTARSIYPNGANVLHEFRVPLSSSSPPTRLFPKQEILPNNVTYSSAVTSMIQLQLSKQSQAALSRVLPVSPLCDIRSLRGKYSVLSHKRYPGFQSNNGSERHICSVAFPLAEKTIRVHTCILMTCIRASSSFSEK